jgi:hypothetical protein
MSWVSRREPSPPLPFPGVRPRGMPAMRVDRPDHPPRAKLTPEQRLTVGRVVIAAGCAYELVSLFHPKLPTISELVFRASNHKVLRFGAWCFCGYAIDHFVGGD